MPPKRKFSLTALDKKKYHSNNKKLKYHPNYYFKKKNIIVPISEEIDVKKRKKNKPFNDLGKSTKVQFMEKAAPIIVNAISEVFIANGRSTPSNNDIVSFSAEFHNKLNSSNQIETPLSLLSKSDQEAKLTLSKTPMVRRLVESYGVATSSEDKTKLLSTIVSSFTKNELNSIVFNDIDFNTKKKLIQVIYLL
jgi:hypothetical protein